MRSLLTSWHTKIRTRRISSADIEVKTPTKCRCRLNYKLNNNSHVVHWTKMSERRVSRFLFLETVFAVVTNDCYLVFTVNITLNSYCGDCHKKYLQQNTMILFLIYCGYGDWKETVLKFDKTAANVKRKDGLISFMVSVILCLNYVK